MNFIYYTPVYPQIVFYDVSYFHQTVNYQNNLQPPQQATEIHYQQPVPLKQKERERQQAPKVPRTVKTIRRSNKKKPKPRGKVKKDSSFSQKTQKQNRNYPSILCKTFLLYLANHPCLQKLVKAVKYQYSILLEFEDFQKTFRNMFDLKKTYVRKELIQAICKSQVCHQQFSLIFRVLFQRFLKLQIFPYVYNTKKIDKKKKAKQSKFAKNLYVKIFGKAPQNLNKNSISEQKTKNSGNKIQCDQIKVQN